MCKNIRIQSSARLWTEFFVFFPPDQTLSRFLVKVDPSKTDVDWCRPAGSALRRQILADFSIYGNILRYSTAEVCGPFNNRWNLFSISQECLMETMWTFSLSASLDCSVCIFFSHLSSQKCLRWGEFGIHFHLEECDSQSLDLRI